MPKRDAPKRLAEKVIVITGAGRGIGRDYALAMASEGARVVVNDLGTDLEGHTESKGPADAVVQEIASLGGRAIASHADIADPAGARSIIDTAREAYGRIDALVNNAAVEFRGSLSEHSSEVFERILAVNVRGTFNCLHAALPPMMEQGSGVILNTTSGSCWEGTEGVAAYSASKAAVIGLMLTQHTELARHGIASNCIAPSATRTRMLDSWLSQLAADSGRSEDDVMREYGIQGSANLAPLAVFLCSDTGRTISGQIFEIAGDRIVRVSPPTRGESISRDADAWSFDEIAQKLPGLTR